MLNLLLEFAILSVTNDRLCLGGGLFVCLVASNKLNVSTSSVHFAVVSWFETQTS